MLLSPTLVAAGDDSDITVLESSADIIDVRLCYQVDRMNYAEVISEGWADFTPASSIEANWVWDMRNASLPPGAEVTYWWMIEDVDGNRFETSPEIMYFDDDRFSWRSLTSTIPQGSELTLFGHWHLSRKTYKNIHLCLYH